MRRASLFVLLALLLAVPAPAARAADVLVLPLQWLDELKAGQQGVVGAEEQRRIRELSLGLREALERSPQFSVLDAEPHLEAIEGLMRGAGPLYQCPSCYLEIAQRLGTEWVAIGWVQRASRRVIRLSFQIVQNPSGKVMHQGFADLGDNSDETWARGAEALISQLHLGP